MSKKEPGANQGKLPEIDFETIDKILDKDKDFTEIDKILNESLKEIDLQLENFDKELKEMDGLFPTL